MRLSELDERIDGLAYPATTAEVVSAVGTDRIDFTDGAMDLTRLLERFGSATFESPADLRLTLYGSLPGEAVGRRHYTDRDPPVINEVDPVSF